MANRKTQSKAVKHPNLVPLESDITADEFDALSLKLSKTKGMVDLLMEAAHESAHEQLYEGSLSAVLAIVLEHVEEAEELTAKLNKRLRPKPLIANNLEGPPAS